MRPPPEAFFEGATVPEWEAIQRLVLILDGELTYFRRLWETAYKNTAAEHPEAAPPPPLPSPTSELVELTTAVGRR
ncbi:hypothetical protein ACWEQ8_02780 [Streptomyces noursei]